MEPMNPKVDSRWRHKKTGQDYIIVGVGRMQTKKWTTRVGTFTDIQDLFVDMEEVVIYSDYKTFWVRPLDEFLDGRFEQLE